MHQKNFGKINYLDSKQRNASLGDTVAFGEFILDAEYNKGPLEWQVIAKEDNKLLLITKDIIIWYAHGGGNTWETSLMREYLADTFYSTAFPYEEKRFILRTEITTNEFRADSTLAPVVTSDLVFILSKEEAEKYMPEPASRVAVKTQYAKKEDPLLSFNDWALRSPGFRADHFTYVDGNGLFQEDYRIDKNGIRPCIWIDLGNPPK